MKKINHYQVRAIRRFNNFCRQSHIKDLKDENYPLNKRALEVTIRYEVLGYELSNKLFKQRVKNLEIRNLEYLKNQSQYASI